VTEQITRSRLIAAPTAKVWAMLADFAAIGSWAPNVGHSSPASDVRDTLGAVRRVQVGRNALLERVTEWVPLHRLTYTIEGLPPQAGIVTTTWQLEERYAASMTTVSTVIEPLGGPRGRVVAKVAARLLDRAADQMLRGLNEYVRDH
jgi:uncharacterized protein YndB with AHSA1/START domain